MANKYFSRERRFWAHYIGLTSLTSGSDYSYTFNPAATYLVNVNQASLDDDSNVIIRNVGLFSNFADGLVWKDPSKHLWARITVKAWAYDSTVFSGTGFSAPGNTFALTGVATDFATEGIAAGNYITDSEYIYRTQSAGANSIQVLDPIPLSRLSQPMVNLRLLNQVSVQLVKREIEIAELNSMIPYDEYFTPSFFAGSPVDMISFEVSLNSNGDTLDFLTDSIDPAFDGSTVKFDFCMDMEYTAR